MESYAPWHRMGATTSHVIADGVGAGLLVGAVVALVLYRRRREEPAQRTYLRWMGGVLLASFCVLELSFVTFRALAARGVATNAVIEEARAYPGNKRPEYFVNVRFTANGRSHAAREETTARVMDDPIGGVVPIVYDPRDPRVVQIGTPDEIGGNHIFVLWPLITGAFALLVWAIDERRRARASGRIRRRHV